jgi:septum site-determining protein MinD
MDNLTETNITDIPPAQVRLVTSAKGGVGKSTVCANLGAALAMSGSRVLLIDCDIANRCLDLMLGLENEVLWGIRDVCDGSVSLSDAIYASPTLPDLHLLAGSRVTTDEIPALTEALPACIREAETLGYDHILIDTPGGLHEILFAASALVCEALIVSSAQATAIRSAEHTAQLLEERGISSLRLIINQFMAADALAPRRFRTARSTKRAREAAVSALFSTVDTVSLPLLGVIPFDSDLWEMQNRGITVEHPSLSDTFFARAHMNIAGRIGGRSIPLFSTEA